MSAARSSRVLIPRLPSSRFERDEMSSGRLQTLQQRTRLVIPQVSSHGGFKPRLGLSTGAVQAMERRGRVLAEHTRARVRAALEAPGPPPKTALSALATLGAVLLQCVRDVPAREAVFCACLPEFLSAVRAVAASADHEAAAIVAAADQVTSLVGRVHSHRVAGALAPCAGERPVLRARLLATGDRRPTPLERLARR